VLYDPARPADAERRCRRKPDFSVIQNLALRLVGNKKTVSVDLDDVHLSVRGGRRPEAVPEFLTQTHEAQWYERHGLDDGAFVSRPLSADELAGRKRIALPDLPAGDGRTLRAGVAKINITPAPAQRRGRAVRANLYARAVVLADGRTTAAIVVLDWLAAFGQVTDLARQLAARLTDIPEQNILIWATHNHSGPPAYGAVGKTGYKADALRRIASAVVRARQRIRAVTVRGATGRADLNFNRRYKLPDGGIAGFLWHKLLERRWDDGFVDKHMGLLVLGAGGKPLAAMVAYAGHANMNCVIDRSYNADYPGVACAALARRLGAPVLLVNGGFGNADMKGNALSLERTVKAGLDVARAAGGLRDRLRPLRGAPVRCGSLSRQAAPMNGKPGRTITVAAVAFGDVAFAQHPGEMYTEFIPQIRKASPYPLTFPAFWRGFYLPTRQAVAQGGYGTDGRGADWGELSRDLSAALLKRLHAGK